MVRRVAAELGRIDILVNGAAAPSGLVRNSVEDADPELLLADINTKVVGYFRCAQAVTPHMRANGYGRIVNIGGLTGRSSHALSGLRNLADRPYDQGPLRPARPVRHHRQHRCTPAWWRPSTSTSCTRRRPSSAGITRPQVEADFVARTPIRRILAADRDRPDACASSPRPRAAAITGESLGIDGGLTRGIFL